VSQPFSVTTNALLICSRTARQTVLPPTIHPNTLMPYTWVTDDTLLDTDIDQLPLLPDNIATLLEEASCAHMDTNRRPNIMPAGDGETMWRDLNDTALLNLDRWVPALKLPDTRKLWRWISCCCQWRGVENANLSFHKDGIKDFGNDEAHTPINVVMLAFGVEMYTATEWLIDQLDFKSCQPEDDGFDVAGFIARSQGETVVPQIPLQKPDMPEVKIIELPKGLKR
jgi:hypothetical protein